MVRRIVTWHMPTSLRPLDWTIEEARPRSPGASPT
jgi:hypothetical protein